jgi:DNA invertase Pin-like site-specific DNA recombinase
MTHRGPGGGGKPVIDLYARLSFAVDGSTINVDEQVEIGTEDIQRRGGVLGRVFKKDNSKSAWNPKVVRPDWLELMAGLESGVSDGVWVLDLTRFTRKPAEGERLIEAAQSGVLVWSQSVDYNLLTADGRAAFRDAMNKAAHESDKISERSRRGKRRKGRSGIWVFGSRGYAMPRFAPTPAGWEMGDPRPMVDAAVIEAEREIVRECYRRLLAGETGVSALAGELNARGVPTATGELWERTTLRRALIRPAHAGLIMFDGAVHGRRKHFDPTVTEEEWERLCALLSARGPGRPLGRVYVLSGLMRCGACGRKMYGQKYQGGQYRCRQQPGNHGNRCPGNSIDANVTMAAVSTAVKARLSDPRWAGILAEQIAAVSEQRAALRSEAEYLESEADSIAEKTRQWGSKRVDIALQPILARIEEITAELEELAEDEPDVVPAEIAAQEWDRAQEAGDVDAMRTMIRVTLPNLTVRRALRWGDHSVSRLDWDGTGALDVPLAPSTRDAVLAAVPVGPQTTTMAEIAAAVGQSRTSVDRYLRELHAEGLVVKRNGRSAANRWALRFSRPPQP